jgi:hypothetical protein
MKKIILLIVFFVYLIHSGWAQDNNTKETTRADELNKARKQLKNEETIVKHFIKVPDDEWPTQVVFDTVHVCYQGTLRWIIMGNPNLIGQTVPNHIARTMTVHCFCVLDKLRTKYKYTPYVDMIDGEDPMMPKFLPDLFMRTAVECIKEHKTLYGLIQLDPNFNIDDVLKKEKKDNETKNDTKIEVKPPDNNSGKSDSLPEQPNELPTEDTPLLNF